MTQHSSMQTSNALFTKSKEDTYQKSIIQFSSNELTQLRPEASLLRRFSTFFGMEPQEKVLHLSPFIAKAVLIASIGGILFGCKYSRCMLLTFDVTSWFTLTNFFSLYCGGTHAHTKMTWALYQVPCHHSHKPLTSLIHSKRMLSGYFTLGLQLVLPLADSCVTTSVEKVGYCLLMWCLWSELCCWHLRIVSPHLLLVWVCSCY